MNTRNLFLIALFIFASVTVGGALHVTGLFNTANAATSSVSTNTSSAAIANVQTLVDSAVFDLNDRNHLIRKKRIEHYLQLARKYEDRGWIFNRNDALERAENILNHHEQKGIAAYASL